MLASMPDGQVRSLLLSVSLMLVLVGSSVGLLITTERSRPDSARAEELSYLPKGEYLKIAVLGYRQIVADLIWLQVLQNFGERTQTTEGYLWAYHAVDVLTDLDPSFVYAYQAAGVVLSVWAHLTHESVAILEKGVRNNPDVWELPFFLGYDYYFELNDPKTAAKYFRAASALPGSPDYLPKLAARMTVEAGDPEAALEFLQRLYLQVQDEKVREGLETRMKEVIAERDILYLEEAVRRFVQRHGRLPQRLEDLISGGIILHIPEEPLGGVYQLNPRDGTVKSTGLRERLRVHRSG